MGVMPSTGSDASAGSDDAAGPVEGGRTAPTAGPRRLLVEECPTDDSGHDRTRGDTAAEHQEAASVPVGHLPRRVASRRSRWSRRVPPGGRRPGQQRPEDGEPRADGHDHGDDGQHLRGQWLAQRGDQRHRARDHEADDPDGPLPACRHTQQRRDEQRTDGDGHVEHQLVVRAEQADHEVLGARRLERDDQVTDGDDDRRRARHEARDELRDGDGHERRDGTRGGGGKIGRTAGEWAHDT